MEAAKRALHCPALLPHPAGVTLRGSAQLVQGHWQSSAPGPEAADIHLPHQEPQGATVPLLPGAPGAAAPVGNIPSGGL